jgi:hypothetical protein
MRKPGPRQSGGGFKISSRLVVLLLAVSFLGVTISSVRYLAIIIATSHHASASDESVVFEADKSSWKSNLVRAVSHIDHVRTFLARNSFDLLVFTSYPVNPDAPARHFSLFFMSLSKSAARRIVPYPSKPRVPQSLALTAALFRVRR